MDDHNIFDKYEQLYTIKEFGRLACHILVSYCATSEEPIMSSTLFMDLYSMVKVRMYVEKNPHSTLS
jgi:hypothetical protein